MGARGLHGCLPSTFATSRAAQIDEMALAVLALLPLPLGLVIRISGSDKEQPEEHHYESTYHRIFRHMKYKRLTLLEIGIGGYDKSLGGESLVAWQCYFPFGKIVGCDIEDKRQLAGGRVRIHVVDQSSATDLARIASQEGPFDIIIDDGSHVNAHQIFSFKNRFAHVKDGGIYVIEDTHTSYRPEWGGKPVNQQTLSTARATSPNSQNSSTILNSALKRPTPINAVVLAENTAVDPPTGRRYLAAAGNYRVKIAPACGRSPIAYSQWPYSSLCWFNFC